MPSEPAAFEGALTLQEYRSARRLHGRGVLPFWAPGILMIVAGLVLGALMWNRYLDLWVPAMMVLAGFVMLAWRLADRWLSRRVWRRHKLLREPVRGRLDADAFHAEAEHGGQRLPWDLLHQWKASDDLLLLYKAPRLFYTLPRRWFTDADAWQRATSLASSRLPSRYESQRKGFLWLAAGWLFFAILTAVNFLVL